jgi:hypothetical protein
LLNGGDAVVEGADVADEVDGQLAAGLGRRAGWPQPAQQDRGCVGGQLAVGACGHELGQQPVQPVQDLGAGGDQVIAPVRQQPQHHGVVLDVDLAQALAAKGGQGDRDRVTGIVFAAVASGQLPHPSGELGRHVDDLVAVGDQLLGEDPADPGGALDGPAPLRPALRGGFTTSGVVQVMRGDGDLYGACQA